MRLALTYLIVATLLVYSAHRWVRRMPFWSGVLLVMLPVVFLGEAFFKNGVYAPLDITYRWEPLASYRQQAGIQGMRTPLLADVVYQHLPWRKAVREALKNGRLPLWNRFQLAGEPLLAVQMSAVLHPETWLGLLLPLAQGWTFAMALRILLASLSAYLLLRDLECSQVAAFTGAIAWALGDFQVFFLGFPPGAGAAPFPLLVLGLRRVARDEPKGFAITVLATCLILAAGHPETSLHAMTAGGLFFLATVWQQSEGRRGRAILKGLLAALAGVSLMAITLVPFVEVLPSTSEYAARRAHFAHTPKAVPLSMVLTGLATQALPYAQGVSGRSEVAPGHEASAYAGAVVWVVALIGLFASRSDRLPFAALGILAVAVAVGCPGLADLVGKLPLFDIAINQRLVFVGGFALSVLAAFGVDALLGGRRRLGVVAAGTVLLGTVGIWLLMRRHLVALQMPAEYMNFRLWLQILPVGLLALALLIRAARERLPQYAWVLPLLLIPIRYAEIGRLYPVVPASAFYPPLDVLARIDRTQPNRFAAFGLTFIPNMSALYELEDVRAYEAMTLGRFAATFPLWCVPQPVWFNRVDDPTKPFLSFLNVRYLFVPADYATPPGWKTIKEGRGGRLLENEQVLPRAFVPRWLWCDKTPSSQLHALAGITDFHDRGVIQRECSPGEWRRNGAATAEIISYASESLRLEVHATAAVFIGTSIPSWPGWRVSIDGKVRPLVHYNYAFLGVEMPAGTHTVTFQYRPEGVRVGAIISGLAIVAIAAAGIMERRRIVAQ